MTQPDLSQFDPSVQGGGAAAPEVTPQEPAPSTDDSGAGALYQAYLDRFPESLRPMATEVFKEWDGNVTKRIQGIHQEYEPYKPLVDTYDAESLSTAAQLAEALDTDPEKVWRAIAETYGFQIGEANPQDPEPGVTDDEEADPLSHELTQQRQLLEAMANTMISERQAIEQAKLEAEQDAAFETVWTDLKTKHGDFDENYVLSLIGNGADPEQAVEHWKSQLSAYASKQLAPNVTAPTVMSGAGGGMPSVTKDTSSMSSADLKALVAQTLEAAAREGR